MKRTLLLLLFGFLASCGFEKTTKPLQEETNYAIIKFDEKPKWIIENGKEANLTNEDINELEKIVSTCFNDNKTKLRTQSDYKRQYLAAVNTKGEKEVWVNCFCEDSNYWRKQIVMVADGGNSYFQFTVNLKTKSYYDFKINSQG